jgi:hypothetical protein
MDLDSREQAEYQTMRYKNQYWLINVIYPLFKYSLSSLTMLQKESSTVSFTLKFAHQTLFFVRPEKWVSLHRSF